MRRRLARFRLLWSWFWLTCACVGTLSLSVFGAEEARLLRFPAIHGDQVVFGYAGDLYTVPASGGVARRLTSDPDSYEMFPRFSPDGRHIAFTAQYDGNTEVYVMPAEGGEPRRLTYTATLQRDDVSDRMGPNNIVLTWRDNESIIYRSRRNQWNPFKGELTIARLAGGVPETLPLPRGGWCSFSPDGRRLAYNRIFREFRTWKRYRGGQADEIWLYDFETKETTRLTENPAQDMFPMWKGDTIYFVSERDDARQANLFALDVKTRETRQITRFTEFAVKFPSLGDNAIVFENGGYIHRLDLATEQVARIPIEILEDLAIGRGGWRDAAREIASAAPAPDGSRAVFGARGDVFTVPAKHGPTRNLTTSPGVHERDVTWSPDGKWIAYISDATHEDEIWIRSQDGLQEPRPLTSGSDTYKYAPEWSPDSRKLAWGDKKNRLQIVDIDSKEVRLVDQSDAFEIRDFAWAPDSAWIAYTKPGVRRFSRIHLFELESGRSIPATDGWFDVAAPAFSSDGKFLFFISDRSFNPTYGGTEWNHVYTDMERIYFVTLAKTTKSPFAPKSDEVKIKAKDDPAPKSKSKSDPPSDPAAKPPDVSPKDRPVGTLSALLNDPEFRKVVTALARGESTPPPHAEASPQTNAPVRTDATESSGSSTNKTETAVKVTVDAEGLTDRIDALPPGPSNYAAITSVGDKVYYLRKGKLVLYELDKEKETELGDVAGYQVTADRKKMLVRTGNDYAIVDLPTGKLDVADKKLGLSEIRVLLDRPAEWSQIYAECWRQMRDFFYAPNLHNVDWATMRKRYEPLLPHVRHRADLTYVIGELIGELNAGHAYVGGGDYPKPERIPQGLLGAELRREDSGYYRITKILRGQNWDPRYRSPLTE
ncbi:MAG: PDZ domain-containing protein, partial [Limisphaerales bacterium]